MHFFTSYELRKYQQAVSDETYQSFLDSLRTGYMRSVSIHKWCVLSKTCESQPDCDFCMNPPDAPTYVKDVKADMIGSDSC